jgi:predicted dehydrogenase
MIKNITVAIVGLGFGAEFVPIYMRHPNVSEVVICDLDSEILTHTGTRFGVDRQQDDLHDVLKDAEIDAVHLNTGIQQHAEHSQAVLQAGKHCACAVPMATSLSDIKAVVAAQHESCKTYMMMETSVMTREFFWVKEQVHKGALGRIQFLRGAHYQDMENWPEYWMGLPPMHYATHAISPLLALANTRAARVYCLGSGRMRQQLSEQYDNPYPVETAIFELENTDVAAEVTRTLFHTGRAYTESFNVYGEKATFEWQQIEEEDPVLFRMDEHNTSRTTAVKTERINIPDRADILPPEIAQFTRRTGQDESNPAQSFLQGGDHGGSHPHLVHEFVRAIIEKRQSVVGPITAANWTAAGVCAHESATLSGTAVDIPDFCTG